MGPQPCPHSRHWCRAGFPPAAIVLHDRFEPNLDIETAEALPNFTQWMMVSHYSYSGSYTLSDQPTPNPEVLQKRLASKCNDSAWSLIEKSNLNSNDITQLLTLSATARHHWHEVGTPSNIAHADLLFAWAMARAGVSGAAVHLANSVLSFFEENGADWERAFAYAAMAAACSADGDGNGLQWHYSSAEKIGAGLSESDQSYFLAAFKSVPKPVA